jgi:hypothetical protein
MKSLKAILLIGLILLLGGGSIAWLVVRPRDRMFRGKPERYWVEHLSYRDEEQVNQWHVQVSVLTIDTSGAGW